MPNLGGPEKETRRLYLGVVQSIAMYKAPVWYPKLVTRRCNQTLLKGVLRGLAIWAAREYRTISWKAATVVAESLLWDLRAGKRMRRGLPAAEIPLQRRSGRTRTRKYDGFWQYQIKVWKECLSSMSTMSCARIIGAIRSVVDGSSRSLFVREWKERWLFGPLTFRLVQVLTGHGCFGEYLHQIGKESTEVCHHCGTRWIWQRTPSWSARFGRVPVGS